MTICVHVHGHLLIMKPIMVVQKQQLLPFQYMEFHTSGAAAAKVEPDQDLKLYTISLAPESATVLNGKNNGGKGGGEREL